MPVCPSCDRIVSGPFGHGPACVDTMTTPRVESLPGRPIRTTEGTAMPKLDVKTAKAVHATEARAAVTLVPPGTYTLKLTGCIVAPKPNKNGDAYWTWSFEIQDEEYKGTKLRENTTVSDASLWTLKRMFDAFEVKPNVNTDTLIGKEIKGLVDNVPQQGGANAGKLRNELMEPLPLSAGGDDDDDWDDDSDDDKKKEEDEDF